MITTRSGQAANVLGTQNYTSPAHPLRRGVMTAFWISGCVAVDDDNADGFVQMTRGSDNAAGGPVYVVTLVLAEPLSISSMK